MDRFAVFVDAGHLLAEGGKLCLGTRKRSLFECDYSAIAVALIDLARQRSGQDLLRVYWYDGAYRGIPTLDHLRIAGLPNVKLRLGRMSGGKQKGVDSLMVRDLMTLGRQRAMNTAFLLAGDEDLREGVKDSQDCGVRVVLLGVRSLETQGNQAETLVQESDEHIVLDRDFFDPHLLLKAPQPAQMPVVADATLGAEAQAIGARFADEWMSKAMGDEIAEVLSQMPSVPRSLDAELLSEGRKTLPTLEKPWLSKELRDGFRERLRAAQSESGRDPSPASN